MTWIDRRLAEKEAARVRHLSIDQASERIYAELWQAVGKCVDEANNKGFTLERNGSPHERTVVLLIPPSAGRRHSPPARRELTLVLKRSSEEIVVKGLSAPPKLTLDLCPDNVACLKLDGNQVNYDDAAQAILNPFLFPLPSGEAESDGSFATII